MRAYHIDDLTPETMRAVTQRLRAMELEAGMQGMYWLPVPATLLSPVQREHAALCGPHAMALEAGEDFLHLELLVRARGRLRCECVHYAAPALQAHMMRYVDELLESLGIDF